MEGRGGLGSVIARGDFSSIVQASRILDLFYSPSPSGSLAFVPIAATKSSIEYPMSGAKGPTLSARYPVSVTHKAW